MRVAKFRQVSSIISSCRFKDTCGSSSGSRREIWKYDDFWCIKNVFGNVSAAGSAPLTLPSLSLGYTKNYVAWLGMLLMTVACCLLRRLWWLFLCLALPFLPHACCQLMSPLSLSLSDSRMSRHQLQQRATVWRWWIASTLFGSERRQRLQRQKECSKGLFCRNFSQLQLKLSYQKNVTALPYY